MDDSATAGRHQSITIDVLQNDNDPDGDPLTITAVSAPSFGNVSINNGVLTYSTPGRRYSGQVNFTYSISDGRGATATASVHVTVTP